MDLRTSNNYHGEGLSLVSCALALVYVRTELTPWTLLCRSTWRRTGKN